MRLLTLATLLCGTLASACLESEGDTCPPSGTYQVAYGLGQKYACDGIAGSAIEWATGSNVVALTVSDDCRTATGSVTEPGEGLFAGCSVTVELTYSAWNELSETWYGGIGSAHYIATCQDGSTCEGDGAAYDPPAPNPN